MIKRHLKIAAAALSILLLIALGLHTYWDMRYVQPRVERWPDPVPLALQNGLAPQDFHYEVAYDLIDMLDESAFDTPLIDEAIEALPKNLDARPNNRRPHLLSRLTTLGSSSNFRRSMRSLHMPPPGSATYKITVPADAVLRGAYGLMPKQSAPVSFSVMIDGEKVFSKTEKPLPNFPYDESGWYYKEIYRYLHIELIDREARWVPFEIDLASWAGGEVEIKLETLTEGGDIVQAFWGTPQILVKKPGPARAVVIYLMDAFTARHMGAYGSTDNLTPALDAYAKNNVFAESFIAGGNWSRPGVTTLLTGKAVPELFLPTSPPRRSLNQAVRKLFESEDLETLATVFHEAGWKSLCVANNYFVMPWAKAGVDMGFDKTTAANRSNISTMDIEYFVAEELAQNSDTNFFLFVHQNAPNPADAPPRRFRKEAAHAWKSTGDYAYGRYLSCVAHADFTFDRFREMLRQTRLLPNTYLFISADHGQLNNPRHDIKTPDGPDEMRKALHFHGQSLYEDELNIPLIISGPGITGGRVLKGQYSYSRIFSTILSLTGLREENRHDPGDMAPLLTSDESIAAPDSVIASFGKESTAIRVDNRYKYIRYRDVNRLHRIDNEWLPEAVREELFDLKSDPEENNNLINSDTNLLLRMRRLYERHVEKFPHVWSLTVPSTAADEVRIFGAKSLCVASGETAIRADDGSLILKPEKMLRLAAFPDPASDNLTITLKKEGRILTRDKLRYGPAFVMPDSRQGYFLDATTNINNAESEHIPPMPEVKDYPHLCYMGLIFWINQMPAGASVDGAIKDLLKQWGYVH